MREAQIKKEKRRRWLLILLPILLIGSLYGGYVLVHTNNSSYKHQQPAKNTITKDNVAEKIKSPIDSSNNINPVIENKNVITETSPAKNKSHQKISNPGKLKMSSDYAIIEGLQKDTSLTIKTVIHTTREIVQNKKINTPQIQNIPLEKISNKEEQPDSNTKLSDKLPEPVIADIKNDKEKNEIKTDTAAKKIQTTIKYPWNWGFTFSPGLSGIRGVKGITDVILGNQDKSLSYASPSSSGTSGNIISYTSSPIRSSIAFITGLTTEKKISRKIIFTTGLNYKLFSTTNMVGTDSSIYFRSTGFAGTHHNFFHYIDLPVGLKFQIGNSIKMPFYFNTGFSISQLISSNALQYNNTTHLYYHDNSLFNKTQFGFAAGFDVGLLSKQKQLLLIGPYFNYSISKISSQGYNKHHFTFIGLRAQFIFKKK